MGLAMLGEMKEILEEHNYDHKFRGVDLKAASRQPRIKSKP
jgi:hypothetical protein